MTFAINVKKLKYFPYIFGNGSFMNHSVTKRNPQNQIKFVLLLNTTLSISETALGLYLASPALPAPEARSTR